MNPLHRILYEYARKYKVDAFLLAEQDEFDENQRMVEIALDRLASTDAQAAEFVGRVRSGGDILADIYANAYFLAGLSVGMELGRL